MESSFGVACRLAVALHLMSSSVTRPVYSLEKSLKSPGVGCHECGGCGTSTSCFPAMSCSTDVTV
jgi:hypothetical protein